MLTTSNHHYPADRQLSFWCNSKHKSKLNPREHFPFYASMSTKKAISNYFSYSVNIAIGYENWIEIKSTFLAKLTIFPALKSNFSDNLTHRLQLFSKRNVTPRKRTRSEIVNKIHVGCQQKQKVFRKPKESIGNDGNEDFFSMFVLVSPHELEKDTYTFLHRNVWIRKNDR